MYLSEINNRRLHLLGPSQGSPSQDPSRDLPISGHSYPWDLRIQESWTAGSPKVSPSPLLSPSTSSLPQPGRRKLNHQGHRSCGSRVPLAAIHPGPPGPTSWARRADSSLDFPGSTLGPSSIQRDGEPRVAWETGQRPLSPCPFLRLSLPL